MDFSLTPELLALRERVRQFIAEQVIPLENDPRQDHHGPHRALREELVARARAAGLLTPHASPEMGGLGLSHRAKAVVFEEAGYSWLGPTALNIHAPDEGNIHLMEQVATQAQKEIVPTGFGIGSPVGGEFEACELLCPAAVITGSVGCSPGVIEPGRGALQPGHVKVPLTGPTMTQHQFQIGD